MVYMVFDEKDLLRIVTTEWEAAFCMVENLVHWGSRPRLEIYSGDRMIFMSADGA